MKMYSMVFGSGNPQTYTGLAPTMIVYRKFDGTTLPPPGITEVGTTTGIYGFTCTPSFPIFFIADGFTTGLATGVRYVSGQLDPNDAVNEQAQTLLAISTTLLALGTTQSGFGITAIAYLSVLQLAIGTTASSYGTTATDPVDLYGYMKRNLEFQEGNSIFNKSSGIWAIYSRGTTSSMTELREKTLSNAASMVIKT